MYFSLSPWNVTNPLGQEVIPAQTAPRSRTLWAGLNRCVAGARGYTPAVLQIPLQGVRGLRLQSPLFALNSDLQQIRSTF